MQHTPFKFLPQDRTPVPEFVTLYAPFWRDALPNGTWSWNPWTGTPRAHGDKESDPLGKLIVPPGEEVEAARPTVYGVPLDDYVDWRRRNLPIGLGPSDEAYRAVQYAGAQTVKVVRALRVLDTESPTPQSGVLDTAPPTFDEWFKAKNGGLSFDAVYWQAGTMLADHIRALSREARAYVSEIVQGANHG